MRLGRFSRLGQFGGTSYGVVAWIVFLGITVALIYLAKEVLIGGIAGTTVPERIILVTVDTLRADHVSIDGYPREVAPFIDSLARRGVYFSNAYSAAPHTAPSHATIFTSLYPFEHRVRRNHEVLDDKILNLATFCKSKGYEIAGIPAVRFLDGKVGFPSIETDQTDQGFGVSRRFWYRNATQVVDRTITWLTKESKRGNLCLWIHFYDVHQWKGNQHIPERYNSLFPIDDKFADWIIKEHKIPAEFFGDKGKLSKAINGYDSRLRYVDDELNRLYKKMEDEGLIKNSLWVITADHGEGLGNHNYEGHGQFLYNEQLRVPLIFFASNGGFKNRVVNDLVRTVDIFPTVAEILGENIKGVNTAVRGWSLAPALAGGPVGPDLYAFAERRPKDMVSFRKSWEEGEIYSIQDEESKLIEHTLTSDEFFDLKSDPFEVKNLSGAEQAKETALRDQVTTVINRADNPTIQNDSEPDVNEEQLEELKTLGYL